MAHKCLLDNPDCKENCGRCGWDSMEEKRRKKQLEKDGLTTCKNGLRRLIIEREDSEE